MKANVKSLANSWKNGKSCSGYFSVAASISSAVNFLYPKHKVRIQSSAYSACLSNKSFLLSSNDSSFPSSTWNFEKNSPTLSGAPFAYKI